MTKEQTMSPLRARMIEDMNSPVIYPAGALLEAGRDANGEVRLGHPHF
jgi:hypothetical protein